MFAVGLPQMCSACPHPRRSSSAACPARYEASRQCCAARPLPWMGLLAAHRTRTRTPPSRLTPSEFLVPYTCVCMHCLSFLLFVVHVNTHTCTQTHTSYMHTPHHACICTHHACICTHTHTHTHTHHTHIPNIVTYTNMDVHTEVHMHTHIHPSMHTCTHTHPNMHAHTHACACLYTQMHACVHTHASKMQLGEYCWIVAEPLAVKSTWTWRACRPHSSAPASTTAWQAQHLSGSPRCGRGLRTAASLSRSRP